MRSTAFIVGIAAVALAGCGGGTKAADTTTIINQTVMPSATSAIASATSSPAASTPAASTAASPAAGSAPQTPAGATQVGTDIENGLTRFKFSIADQLPNQVTEYYANLWRNDGYTIITSTSGPDSGRKGGATAVASKNGVFVGVEADADPGEPTHFEVCQGSDERSVRGCID